MPEVNFFVEGDEDFAQNFRHNTPWVAWKIIKCSGPLSFKIELRDGRVIRLHQDHIRKCKFTDTPQDANPLCSSDEFTATLDFDSSNMPKENFPVNAPSLPRRNPP